MSLSFSPLGVVIAIAVMALVGILYVVFIRKELR